MAWYLVQNGRVHEKHLTDEKPFPVAERKMNEQTGKPKGALLYWVEAADDVAEVGYTHEDGTFKLYEVRA